MAILLSTTTLTLSLLLPATAPLAVTTTSGAHGLTPGEAAALLLRVEQGPTTLEALRAGGASAPESLRAGERSALAVAESQSASLAALRGGFEPSNNEWKWLAIGAGVVLLIILI